MSADVISEEKGSESRRIENREGLIFEHSKRGRRGYRLPPQDVPETDAGDLLPKELLRGEIEGEAEVSEVREILRVDAGVEVFGEAIAKQATGPPTLHVVPSGEVVVYERARDRVLDLDQRRGQLISEEQADLVELVPDQ